MIIDGLKLALVGMIVVFAFLGLLVVIVLISSKILKSFTEKEEREMVVPARQIPSTVNGRLIAVISAAVACHRAGRNAIRIGPDRIR